MNSALHLDPSHTWNAFPGLTADASEGPRMVDTATDVAAVALARLQATPQLRGCIVNAIQQDGKLVIRGVVGSFYQKQIAHVVLDEVVGTVVIFNELEVVTRRETYQIDERFA